MKRRGVRVLEFITAAACAAIFGMAPLPAAEEPAEPEFLGPAEPEQILKISPEWKAMYDAYTADAADRRGIREAVAPGPGRSPHRGHLRVLVQRQPGPGPRVPQGPGPDRQGRPSRCL